LRVLIVGDWAAAGASVKSLRPGVGVLRLPASALDFDRAGLRAAP
jgi:hypothetical protein